MSVVRSGASGVAGVWFTASEEAGLSGYLQRGDDFSSESHRVSGKTTTEHTAGRKR